MIFDLNLQSTCGIYKITNLSNGKFYIGSSVRLRSRLTRHIYELNSNIHPNDKMQRSFNACGGNFKIEILEYCNNDCVRDKEKWYIETLNPSFNLTTVCNQQVKLSESTLLKRKLNWESLPEDIKTERLKALRKGWEKNKIDVLSKISTASKTRIFSRESHIKRQRSAGIEPLGLYDIDGRFYKSFEFVSDVAKYVGRCEGTIPLAIKLNRYIKSKLTGQLFIVKRKICEKLDPIDLIPPKSSRKGQPINVYKHDHLLGKYCSVQQASEELKISHITLRNWMRGVKSQKGFTVERV